MCSFRAFLPCSVVFCALLFFERGAISAQQPFSLLPKSGTKAAQKPQLERLADEWLEAIGELSSVWPGGLREASAEEAELLAAIVELAGYYGFESRRYSLPGSFSGNLEILLPALEESDQRSGREVVFVTPVSGLASADIVSLLLLMAIRAKELLATDTLPVRLAFLGSELPPPEISPNLSQYGLGSKGFLAQYPLRRPYSLIYLFHSMEPLPSAVPAAQRLRDFADYFGQSLKQFWVRYRNPDEAPISHFTSELENFRGFDYRIIYSSSLHQSPAKIVQALSATFDSAGMDYFFANKLSLLDKFAGYARFGQFDPYLEAQWPLGAVYQERCTRSPGHQVLVLAQSLRHFIEWQRVNTYAKTDQKMANADRMKGIALGTEEETGNYWLGKFPVWGTVLINERDLLGLFLLAIALFAVCVFCVRLEWARLYAQKCAFWAIKNAGGVLLFVSGCLFLAVVLVPLVMRRAAPLKSLPEFNPFQSFNMESIERIFDAAKNPALDYWAVLLSLGGAFAEILGALLLLYCGALALLHTKSLKKLGNFLSKAAPDNCLGSAPKTLWLLLYLAQFWTFAVSFGFLFMDLHLVVLGLYSFFMVLLYSVFDALFRAVAGHWVLRWLLHWLKQIVCGLVFVPYFLPILLFGAGRVVFVPRYFLALLFILPGLLLCARQIALRRAFAQAYYAPFYPALYRRYLLGRIFACSIGISVCIGMVSLLYNEEIWKMSNVIEPKPIGSANMLQIELNLPALRLEETYSLKRQVKALRLYLATASFMAGLHYPGPQYIEKFFRQLELQDRGIALDFSEFRRESGEEHLQILGQMFRADKNLTFVMDSNFANASSFVWQRKLSDDELSELSELGQGLLRSDNRALRRHYSSEVRLQSRSPLTQLHIDIVGLGLLFANFPFSVPAGDRVGNTASYIPWFEARSHAMERNLTSSLALGFYPPPLPAKSFGETFSDSPLSSQLTSFPSQREPLRIELLFSQPSAQLKYGIKFLLPNSVQQEQLLQQRDPLASFVFPMTSTLRTKTGKRLSEKQRTYNMRLEPRQDYLHVVQIIGLEKSLNFVLP